MSMSNTKVLNSLLMTVQLIPRKINSNPCYGFMVRGEGEPLMPQPGVRTQVANLYEELIALLSTEGCKCNDDRNEDGQTVMLSC
jgi:hypothetical protein